MRVVSSSYILYFSTTPNSYQTRNEIPSSNSFRAVSNKDANCEFNLIRYDQPTRTQSNETSRGRDAYNAHFFTTSTSSMSYGGFGTSSSEDYPNSSSGYYPPNPYPSHSIPSSSSLHGPNTGTYVAPQNSFFQIPSNQFANSSAFSSPPQHDSGRSSLAQSAPAVETDEYHLKPLQPFFATNPVQEEPVKPRTKRRKPGKVSTITDLE